MDRSAPRKSRREKPVDNVHISPIAGFVATLAFVAAIVGANILDKAHAGDTITGAWVIVFMLFGLYILFALKVAQQWEKAVAAIQNLPPRAALVKRRGASVAQIRTENIPLYSVTADEVDALEEQLARTHGESLSKLDSVARETADPSIPVQLVDWETVTTLSHNLYDAGTRKPCP